MTTPGGQQSQQELGSVTRALPLKHSPKFLAGSYEGLFRQSRCNPGLPMYSNQCNSQGQ
jgi:hypothetical protein